MDITAIQGDVAAQQAGVLANAAGTSLGYKTAALLCFGVVPATRVPRSCLKGPVDLDKVVVTDCYGLDAASVIYEAACLTTAAVRLPPTVVDSNP